jgi:thioredoxin-like negative regulator of GroEL
MARTTEVPNDLLSTMRTFVDDHLQSVHPERRVFFEALHNLQQGDIKEATRLFRKASRQDDLRWLASYGLARCDLASGKAGAALKRLRGLAEDEAAPTPLRYLAWLNIAAVDEDRGDEPGVLRASRALDAIGQPAVG